MLWHVYILVRILVNIPKLLLIKTISSTSPVTISWPDTV
jgi:hypothetical protein